MEENMVPNTTEITDDDKLWALLSWITGVVAIVALLMEDKKDRPFIKYNAVMSLVVMVVITVLVGVISAITCGIGAVLALAYFAYEGLPPVLHNIPLEYF